MSVMQRWMNPTINIPRKRDEEPTGLEINKQSAIAFLNPDYAWNTVCEAGYRPLDQCPEIMAGCFEIAKLLGNLTIHLMANTDRGDERIVNELSRKIDIDPMPNMTRPEWMAAIVMNLLLYGKGNSVVVPHTVNGYLDRLEPIAAERVSFIPMVNSYTDYKILLDGQKVLQPSETLHFTYNPDKTYLWKGRGITVSLRDLANSLNQADRTKQAFMKSEYKPSVIVKVDALTEEFASPDGRAKLVESYIHPKNQGEPWIIPAEAFQVEQIKPLTLADLAISDTVKLDKSTVAAIIGVPSFVLGVGNYTKDEWNWFIQTKLMTIAKIISSEMTKKLIISPSWYLKFNGRSIMDWDLKTLYEVYGGLSDKGLATGNEVRDQLGLNPIEGLDELRILENYIPADMIGNQKKLIQGGEDNG